MKYLLAFSIFLLSFSSYGQASKQIFEAPNYKSEIKEHKVIAILPLKVTISYKKLPKGFDSEGNRLEEIKQGPFGDYNTQLEAHLIKNGLL